MDWEKIYREEDLFPREFADYIQRDYGLLFYQDQNKDSYDSNHALLFEGQSGCLDETLEDIAAFYQGKGITPVIYQPIAASGYFESLKEVFAAHGYIVSSEENRYMALLDRCAIAPNPLFAVCKVEKWEDAFESGIFEAAGDPWETAVAKRMIRNPNTLFFAAYQEGRPVGVLYAHTRDGVCRVDYLLVAPNSRGKGAARAILRAFVEYCRHSRIENCFLWPAGESAERIYTEAGFRLAEVRMAGRAVRRVK